MKILSPALVLATGLLGLVQAENAENAELHAHLARNLKEYEYGGQHRHASGSHKMKNNHAKGSEMKGSNKGILGDLLGKGKEGKKGKCSTITKSITVTRSIAAAALGTAPAAAAGTGSAVVQLSFVTTTVFGTGMPPTVTVTPIPMIVTEMTTVTQTISQCAANASPSVFTVIPAGSAAPSAVIAPSVAPPAATSILTASGSPAAVAVGSPGAVATGTGTTASDGTCACQCLCGTGSFPYAPMAAQPAALSSATTLQTVATSPIPAGSASPSAVTTPAAAAGAAPIFSNSTLTASNPAGSTTVAVAGSLVSASVSSTSSSVSSTSAAPATGVVTATPDNASLNLGKLTATTSSGTQVSAEGQLAASRPTPVIGTVPVSISDPVNINTSALSSALILGNLAAPASTLGF